MNAQNIHTARLFSTVRHRHKWTVRALARRLGMAASTLSRIESGHIAPSQIVVEKLLQAVQASDLKELFKSVYR